MIQLLLEYNIKFNVMFSAFVKGVCILNTTDVDVKRSCKLEMCHTDN